MRVGSKPRTLIMFGMLLLFTSCGTGGCHNWGNAPRTEYYIQGGEISFAAGTTAQVEVLDFTRAALDNQDYFMNLWRVDAVDSDEQYKLEQPCRAANHSQFDNYDGARFQPPTYDISGPLVFQGAALGFDLAFAAHKTSFSRLNLYGTCNLADAQRLIKQVRLPAWSNNTSDDTAQMDWRLTGEYEGVPFSVNFTQVFQGRSRYPVYPERW